MTIRSAFGDTMKSCRNVVASLCLTLAFCAAARAQTYDLVINNGRVMDRETMYDEIANVGVKDGRIAAITKEKITGKETIDDTGAAVLKK